MAMLRNVTRGQDVTPYASLVQVSTPTMVSATAMDGTTYLQSIGKAATVYRVTAYVQPEGRAALDSAWWACDLMEVTVRRGTYRGRITALSYGGRQAKDWYQATITLAKEEE